MLVLLIPAPQHHFPCMRLEVKEHSRIQYFCLFYRDIQIFLSLKPVRTARPPKPSTIHNPYDIRPPLLNLWVHSGLDSCVSAPYAWQVNKSKTGSRVWYWFPLHQCQCKYDFWVSKICFQTLKTQLQTTQLSSCQRGQFRTFQRIFILLHSVKRKKLNRKISY